MANNYEDYAIELPELTTAGYTAPTTDETLSLSEAINAFNQQQQQSANAARIPNAAALEQQSSANISSQLSGQLPTDVLNLLGQSSAERGVSIGSPGSANANAAYLRALGLTSYDLTNQGQQNLTSALGRNPSASLFDIGSYMMTPYQEAALTQKAQELESARQQASLQAGLTKQQIDVNRLKSIGGTASGGTGTSGTTGTTGTTASGIKVSDILPTTSGTGYYTTSSSGGTGSTGSNGYYDISGLTDTGGVDFLDWAWSGDTGNNSEYYDISGLTDTGGVDFLDWAYGDTGTGTSNSGTSDYGGDFLDWAWSGDTGNTYSDTSYSGDWGDWGDYGFDWYW